MKFKLCGKLAAIGWIFPSKIILVMKLTTLLLIIACVQVSAKGYAQMVTLSEKNIQIAEVFTKLHKQTGYSFFYKYKFVKDIRVSVELQDVNIEQALNAILKDQPLTYSIVNKTVVLKRKEGTDATKDVGIPPVTIKGKVLDENGKTLPGVTIKVKGSNTGVVTDSEGSFTFTVPEHATIVVSFIGYESQEIALNGELNLTVKLTPSLKSLDQVIVIGYGAQKKSDITGSVARADLESFRQSPNTNLVQLLQGTVPGLNIGQVSSAGQSPTIQIRGQSTISGSQNVLIVLDGIVYSGDISSINPNDIASIDILKDASSKAIYGASAANGVLLISTKKGKAGSKPVINFSSSYATQNPASQLHPLDRNEFIQKVKDINWRQAYLAPDYLTPNPAFDLRSKLDATQVSGYDNGTDYNWYKAATNPGLLYDQQLSVSNATEKTNFFISGGYTKQKGFVINDQFNRKSIRINLETKVFDWLTVRAQAFTSLADYSGNPPDLRSIMLYSPLNTPYSPAGAINLTPNASINNPFLSTYGSDYNHRNTLSGNFYGIFNIPHVKGLTYRLNYGNGYYWNQHYMANQYSANFTGAVSKVNDATYDYTLDNILNYKRTFGTDHSIDLTMVYGARERKYETTSASGAGYNNISLGYNSLQQGLIQQISSNAYSETYNYQTARLSYGYKSKYLLTSTIRRDGFSGFASNKKFGVFPSVAAAWVASNESFLKINWLDNLKLRMGYGSNGNLTNRYASLATVSQGAAYVFGDAGGTLFGQQVATLANNNLSWETTTGINIGVDFSLLNGRISGAVDYYNTSTNNLLFSVNIPTITGFSSINTNVGEINNSGAEFTLNTINVKVKDFQWSTVLNYATNKNKIKKLLGSGDLVSSNLFIGQPLGAIYNYKTDGIWQIGETPPGGYYTGGNKLVDVNGDGKITSDDRVILGHTEPAYRFSIGNTFSYQQFSLFVFINSVQGGKNGYLGYNNPWSDTGIQQGDNAIRNNWFKEVNYWTPSNPNAAYRITGSVPAIDPGIYQDRSFVRLQEVSLSYNFSSALINKVGIKNLRVFLSGKNLATWTKWKGWDPETIQGFAYGASPVIKAYSAGLNVTF